MAGSQTQLIEGLNALTAGLILLTAFGMVATRQVQGVMRFFVVQSAILAASAFLIGFNRGSIHLLALGAITVAAKVIAIPWVLKRTLPGDLYERREINQVINIPSSLLLALLLAIAAEFLVSPLLATTADPVIHANLPIGLAGILIGGYSLIARREALPQIDRHPRHGKWRLLCRHRNRSRSSSDCRIGNRDRCGSDRCRRWRTHAEHYGNDWNNRSSIHERTERGASVMALIVAVSLPLLAALLCWVKPLRSIAWGTTVFCLTISFAAAVMTAGQVLRSGRAVAIPGWIEVDGLGSLVLLLVTFVCTLAAIFAGGYMRHGSHQATVVVVLLELQPAGFCFGRCACARQPQPGVGRSGVGYPVRNATGSLREYRWRT